MVLDTRTVAANPDIGAAEAWAGGCDLEYERLVRAEEAAIVERQAQQIRISEFGDTMLRAALFPREPDRPPTLAVDEWLCRDQVLALLGLIRAGKVAIGHDLGLALTPHGLHDHRELMRQAG